MKILVLGAGGMLGHSLFRYFHAHPDYECVGAVRSLPAKLLEFSTHIETGFEATQEASIRALLQKIQPQVVLNAVGVIKQLDAAHQAMATISINALFPHVLQKACGEVNTRLIHFSTDCVFDGKTGNYTEDSFSNAIDLYGRTKFLGEVQGANTLTLRTSIIGHEPSGKAVSLVDWFLSQQGHTRGYTHAIYTGFPTIEIAHILHDYVLPNSALHGLYQAAAEPINKYELLKLIALHYGKKIEIEPYADFVLDRSLNGTRFNAATGYHPPAWDDLVAAMKFEYDNYF